MTGTITRRGKRSWRLKYDLPRDETGERRLTYVTIKGTRKDAEKELRARLTAIDRGTHVDPSEITVGDHLDNWLEKVAPRRVAPKALERYRGLARNQIKPHLGTKPLQRLRPKDVDDWHQTLLDSGTISTRTVRHAHGLLRTALAHAAEIEIVERNVAAIIKPPTATKSKVAILTEDQITDALRELEGHSIYPVAALAIGTGARRGEIAGLIWSDFDLDAKTVTIQRSLEQTKAGIRVKAPKTEAGTRTISLPVIAVDAIRDHRRQTLELRMALGVGALPADVPVFGNVEGEWPNPYSFTDRWRDAVKTRRLPRVTFHSLRHSHASALIASGLDVVAVSRRLGHSSPSFTLNTYAHLFKGSDSHAAAAIDAVFS
jgi:integrase